MKHGQACAEAGSIQYRKLLLEEELAQKNALIRELNHKAHAVMKAEAEKKKDESQPDTSTPDLPVGNH